MNRGLTVVRCGSVSYWLGRCGFGRNLWLQVWYRTCSYVGGSTTGMTHLRIQNKNHESMNHRRNFESRTFNDDNDDTAQLKILESISQSLCDGSSGRNNISINHSVLQLRLP